MAPHWDNFQVLQAVDRHQQLAGGTAARALDGRELMEEVAGSLVTEDRLHRGFIQELEILAGEGYLTCRAYQQVPSVRQSHPYQYLQQLRDFALTVKGQDRARGIVVTQPPPDPEADDGRPISSLLLQRIARAIAEEYRAEQILVFLNEAGIPLDRLPVPAGTPQPNEDPVGCISGILFGLDQWGSDGRRILRGFVGSWLDDRLISGPTDQLRISLIEQFARQGWYVKDGNLVVGEPAQGQRVSSPLLRDARLAALHPAIVEVAGRLLKDGHRSAAVFEAVKAVNNRVKRMTGLAADGSGLMGMAFKDDGPAIALADLSTQTGRDIQAGYRFLFMGAQQAIRNPSAHEQFGHVDDDETFELLGLASHLMRKLDQASRSGPQGTT